MAAPRDGTEAGRRHGGGNRVSTNQVPSDWDRLELLFEAAMLLPPSERRAFLDRESLPPDVREEVESLLIRAEPAGRLFDAMAASFPTAALEDKEDSSPFDPLLGQRVGRYLISERIGGGGMGVLYRARDTRLEREVALKFLSPHLDLDPAAKDRFLVEARAAAVLDHPDICTVHEIGETDDGRLFIAMAYYDGETLKERIARGPLPVADAVTLATRLARALAAAHERGIVHRDVKPANVMLTRNGGVKLLDFGLAKVTDVTLTRPGTTPGTTAYMSPEQVQGEPVDGRSDLWSLGVVLYEMLAGMRPFRGGADTVIVDGILHQEPEPVENTRPETPVPVARAVARLLQKDPTARYGSAEELVAELLGEVVPPPAPSVTLTPSSTPSRSGRQARQVALVIGVGGIIWAAALLPWKSGPGVSPGDGNIHTDTRTIAVLPFVNVGGDPENEYLSDGLSEELISALSRLRAIRVTSRTSAFALKGDQRDIRDIGRALNVDAVLEGSVRHQGDRIRVVARLVGVTDGFQLWSATYERETADILAIQSDIALHITNALEAELTPADRARLTRKPTESAEAHALYLKGRYFWHRRSESGFEKAVDYFQQALAVDPTYALAHAGLASAYAPLGVFGYIHPQVARERMREAAYRAVELDGESAEAHTALAAYLHVHQWDPAGAEREYLRAIELDPNFSTAHHWYGYMLVAQGRFDEALAQQRLAVALDPLAPVHTASLGFSLLTVGLLDSATVRLREVLDLDPGFWLVHEELGLLSEARGDFAEAVRPFENAVEAGHTKRARAGLARMLALAGRTAEARRLVDALVAEGTRDGIHTPEVASALYALGDTAAAFDWLEAAYRQRHPDLQHAALQVGFSGLEKTARFAELMQRTGFRAIDWAAAVRRSR